MRWCLARSLELLKALRQPGCWQMYGFSPVWLLRWIFRFSRRENALVQPSNWEGKQKQQEECSVHLVIASIMQSKLPFTGKAYLKVSEAVPEAKVVGYIFIPVWPTDLNCFHLYTRSVVLVLPNSQVWMLASDWFGKNKKARDRYTFNSPFQIWIWSGDTYEWLRSKSQICS